MEESEAVAWNIQPYFMNSGYAGICPKGIREYEYHMDGNTFHIGSTKLYDDPDTIRNLVKNAPHKGPLFLNIFLGTAIKDLPKLAVEIADNLKKNESAEGVEYFFLRSMDVAATFRAWKNIKI